MAITSTPVAGRIRFTYGNNIPGLSYSGINPNATAEQINSLTNAIESLQRHNIYDTVFTVEHDLEQS